MKMVRIVNGKVYEIIPDTARPVEAWYGSDFAAQCVEAPDEVEQHWTYNPETVEFSPPAPYEPEPVDRLTALEADVTALTEAVERGMKL